MRVNVRLTLLICCVNINHSFTIYPLHCPDLVHWMLKAQQSSRTVKHESCIITTNIRIRPTSSFFILT